MSHRFVKSCASALGSLPGGAAFACSGLRVGEHIAAVNSTAGYHAAAVGLLATTTLVLWRGLGRRWEACVIALGLFATHPAWTVSANGGDCGGTKRDFALAYSVAAGCCVLWQVVARPSRR